MEVWRWAMGRNFDNEITAIESQLNICITEMDELRLAFVRETIAFLQPWYLREAEAQVKRNPEKIIALGEPKIAELKSAVKKIQAEAPKAIADILSRPEMWWHLKQDEQRYAWYGNRAPEPLNKAVRLAAGRLAPALEACGLIPTGFQEHGVWREWDKSGNHHPYDARHCYNTDLEWPSEMRRLVEQYDKCQIVAVREKDKLAVVKTSKAESAAKDLWDKA